MFPTQIIHIHRPLEPLWPETIVSGHEFIGAVCPGNPAGNDKFDFKGCAMDNRYNLFNESPTYV